MAAQDPHQWSHTKSRRDVMRIAPEGLLGSDKGSRDSPIGTCETNIIEDTMALCNGFVVCTVGGMGSNAAFDIDGTGRTTSNVPTGLFFTSPRIPRIGVLGYFQSVSMGLCNERRLVRTRHKMYKLQAQTGQSAPRISAILPNLGGILHTRIEYCDDLCQVDSPLAQYPVLRDCERAPSTRMSR